MGHEKKRVQKNTEKAVPKQPKRQENLKTTKDMTQQDKEWESSLRFIHSPILPFCRSFNYVCTVQSRTHSPNTIISGPLKKKQKKKTIF